jgi:hypothetical protein
MKPIPHEIKSSPVCPKRFRKGREGVSSVVASATAETLAGGEAVPVSRSSALCPSGCGHRRTSVSQTSFQTMQHDDREFAGTRLEPSRMLPALRNGSRQEAERARHSPNHQVLY